jgi:ATP-dependent DNA helicase RecG
LIKGISQNQFYKWVLQAIDLNEELPELLPDEVLQEENFVDLNHALLEVHNLSPEYSANTLYPGLKRLIFEELLAYQLAMLKIKNNKTIDITKSFTSVNYEPFVSKLGFTLTLDQEKVVREITFDLTKNYPMQRLVQGDVGCGKTIVAAIASLCVTFHKHQVAYMAPTSLLAEQVSKKFQEWFPKLNVALLTGKLKVKEKRNVLQNLQNGKIDIVVGTHALFQEKVIFSNLSLAIIDEQQRFGVGQRLALRQKSESLVHQLFLSATPIPRTMAMALYADLDISYIKTMPKNRLPINTALINNKKRTQIISKIENIVKKEEQVYWICPLVEENEELSLADVNKTFESLKVLLPNIKIGMVHGKSKDKESIFYDFSQGKTNLLVATTVVEVGMDVPKATLIVIENPERLGLSTLHQLRGRVGRGEKQSFCILMYQEPLNDTAKTRLEYLRTYSDGFVIAQKDLQLRGFGEIIGTRQTGYNGLQVADLARDHNLVPIAKQWAQKIWHKYPNNAEQIIKRWLNNQMEYTVV